MKRYYIPTSTLNFNNILSTESISPYMFYLKRGYGYSRWQKTNENALENSIVLYENPFSFTRNNDEVEDHPLLVEICSDEEFKKVENGVYISKNTIYLTPENTKFIFFSEEDKRTTLSLSDSSLETKMLRLYQRNLIVETYRENTYNHLKKEPNKNVSEEDILKDCRINKIKAMLYGYYIGAILSTSFENVQRKALLENIYNIFSSIVSAPDKHITQTQLSALKADFFSLLRKEPWYSELSGEFNDDQIEKIIKGLKKHNKIKNIVLLDDMLSDIQTGVSHDCTALRWVQNEIKSVNDKISSERKLLNTRDSEIVFIDAKLENVEEKLFKSEKEKQLYKSIYQLILNKNEAIFKISEKKTELADDITKEAKQIYNEEWETSNVRSFLNMLRRHLRGEEFNQKWDNGLLSSIAAVLIKGEDWEKLLHFMQHQRMSDYRIALSLFGLFTGFANLTRDFTDILLNEGIDYVKDVYAEFHGQLFGKNIIAPISKEDGKSEKKKRLQQKKEKQNKKKYNNNDEQPDLFNLKETPGTFNQPLFVDSSPDEVVKFISGNDEFKKKIKENLTQFFKLHKKGGYYEKNKKQYKRNNDDTVDHFIWSCCSKKTSLANKFNKDDPLIQTLKEELTSKYHD